jgi:hypothetical protein
VTAGAFILCALLGLAVADILWARRFKQVVERFDAAKADGFGHGLRFHVATQKSRAAARA